MDSHNNLIKMACIQAGINDRPNITVDDVENAFKDLMDFWKLELDFIIAYLKVKDVKDLMREALDESLKACLKILYDKKCFSEKESKLSIKEFDEQVAKLWGTSPDYARKKYRNKLKDKG